MSRRLSLVLLACGLLLGGRASAQAVLVNGGFETGDFTGWTTTNSTAVITQYGSITPYDGSYMARMQTASSHGTGFIEEFLGLAQGSLSGLGSPTVGSAIKQEITVPTADRITFWWQFTTSDYLPFNDFAFYTLDGQAFLLSNVASVGDHGSSGWQYLCLLYTSPSPRDLSTSRMPSSA